MARKTKTEKPSNWTLLLVDDDTDYAQSTAKLLEREGHTVLLAHNGPDALSILRARQIDLMLLDYFMPGMTGEAVVAELRTFNAYVQVILQTGYASEQPPRELLNRLDIQGYHDKSEGPDKLLLWTDIGLKAARTVQLLYKNRQSLRYLLDASFELHRIQSIDTSLQTILSQVVTLVGAQDSFLATAAADTHEGVLPSLRMQASTGRFAGLADPRASLAPEAYAQACDALREARILVSEHGTTVPLTLGEDVLGVVHLEARIDTQSDIELLRIFARQSAVALQNSNLFEQTQQQLIQSEKMASIGQLAAGVAHEINNPIGYVSSNFSTLEQYHSSIFEMLNAYEATQKQLGSQEAFTMLSAMRNRLELDFLLQDIPVLMSESKEGLSRVQKIVQDLKCFSRVDASQEWQLAQIHDGIDSTLNIVNNEVKYIADVVKQYGVVPEIECLPSQLNQVVMNLVVNAAHAIGPARGTITLRSGTEGDYVWLEIEDNGSGIHKEHLPRIFDPFFTTKPVGKGTGLGLSLSYGIIQRHHGKLEVRSTLGSGTTFRITLPIRQPR